MDFKVVDLPKTGLRTVICKIASATVIPRTLCELSSGLPVLATAVGAKLAYAPLGSVNGDTQIELTVGNDFTLQGDGDAVFADSMKGAEVDIVADGSTGQLLVDVGSSLTDVLVIDISEQAGVVGSTKGIRFKINKVIF